MKTRLMPAHRARLSFLLAAACLLGLPAWAMAQQEPLTGRMMGGHADASAPAPAAAAVPAAPAATAPLRESATPPDAYDTPAPDAAFAPGFRAAQVGDTTRYLLQLQADDSRPGNRLPMLGDEASAAYDRYMKSFSHAIPEFYEPSVSTSGNSGR